MSEEDKQTLKCYRSPLISMILYRRNINYQYKGAASSLSRGQVKLNYNRVCKTSSASFKPCVLKILSKQKSTGVLKAICISIVCDISYWRPAARSRFKGEPCSMGVDLSSGHSPLFDQPMSSFLVTFDFPFENIKQVILMGFARNQFLIEAPKKSSALAII